MANKENLQMGLSLNVDLKAFEEEWKSKQTNIQNIINGHTFDVKIGGIQGLAEVQKEMERFARGVRASSKIDLVNTDSIKGLKDEIRALEITWSGLSETQKYANKETGQLTEFAASLAQRYGALTTQLKEYGLTLKETTKDQQKLAQAQQDVFDSLRKDAYQSLGQPDFVQLQMAEYYKQLNSEMEKQAQITASANKLYQEDLAIKERAGKVLAEAVIAQNQMEQARNADYAALVKQLAAEEKLAETLHNESLRREAYQSMGQRDFSTEQMKAYYEQLEESSRRAKELSDAEAQRGAARYRESQRIQQEKQRELQLQQEEYEALRRQLREEAKLASMQKNRRDNERYTSQQKRISEGLRIQQILTTEAKTLDAINQRLAIQRQRLGEAAIGSAKYKKIEKDIAALEARLRVLNGTQQRSVSTTNAQTAAFQRQSGVLNGLKQFMNSYISLLGGYRLFSNIKQITSEFELQRVSLRAITQDAQFADALFAKIKTTATESPFATKELVTYTKQLAAYRIENEELYGTMNMLADVSAGLGVGMDRLILAYGQVKAASVLRGTELRQFTEAGIPLVDELAKKFSQLRGEVVSTGEVFDLISTRQVPFEMVSEIFKEMTAEGGRFYEMQKKQSESLYGVFENLKDTVQNSFDAIGRSQRGLLMGIAKLATVGVKNFDLLMSAITPLIAGMGAYRVATVLATKGSLGLATSSSLLAKAEAALNKSRTVGNAQLKLQQRLMIRASATNNRYAIATIKAATATNVFTRSWYALKAAIIANPIGAALVGLTAIISAVSAYTNRLGDTDRAQQRAADTAKQYKDIVEQKFNLKGYDELSKRLKEQEDLLKSQKESYKDFAKIYPELAEKYKTQEDRTLALNQAEQNRKNILQQIKADYPEYFSYLDTEKSRVADLTKGYADMTKEMRRRRIEMLKMRAGELESDITSLEDKKGSWWTKFWYGSDFKFFWMDAPFLANLKGKSAELSGITQEIKSLEDASKDAEQAMIRWRKSYKELVDNTISTEELANLNFVSAAENANKKLKELTEEQQRLSNVPEQERDSNIEDRLKTLSTLIPKVQKWLDIYKQTKLEGSDTTPLDNLKSELSLVEKIYKRYGELRRLMSDEAAKADIEEIYGGLTNIDFLDPAKLKARLQKMLKAAQAMGDSGLAIELGLKIQDIDLNDAKDKLEAALSSLSQQIKQQQDASDFFEKMLGLTGDVELSTQLTLGVTGVDVEGGNVGQLLSQQLAEILYSEPVRTQVATEFDLTGDWNADKLEEAIRKGEVSVEMLQNLADKLPQDVQPKFREALASFVDFNKQQIESLFKTIDKFGDFDTQVKLLGQQMQSEMDAVTKLKAPDGVDQAEWDAYIADAVAAIQRKYNQEFAKLDFTDFQERFAKELENLDAVAVDVVEQMLTELQGMLASGQFDATNLKSLMDLIDKLRGVKIEKQPIKEFSEAWKDLIDAIKKGDKAGKASALSNLEASLSVMQQSAQNTERAISEIIDTAMGLAEALGVTFSDDTEAAIKAFKDGVGVTTTALSVMITVVVALETVMWPLLVIALALGAAFAAISWISGAKVRKANKEIERQEKALKNLERAYKRLEEIQADLVGSDWVRNQYRQIDNLRKQVEAFQAQLNAERSKGKKADEDAIEDYKDKILEAQEEIRQLQKEVTSEMVGTDLASAAKDFAQSWLDAYLSFDDTMGALKASFKDMMSSMVQNSMMAKLVQKRLEPVFAAIDKAYEDAELTPAEWQSIMDMGNKAIKFIDDDLTHLAEMLNLREQLGDANQSDLTGIAKGVAQASEETVLTLAGYANSILYYQIWLKNDVAAIRAILEGKAAAVAPTTTGEGGFNVGQLISLQQQSLGQLQAINMNTGRSADSLSRLEDKIDSIISTAGTSSRKVVNTRLSN